MKKIVPFIYLILFIGVATSIYFTYETLQDVRKLEQSLDTSSKTTEDDVTIASNYVIRSTTQISDAYKSKQTERLSDKDKETLTMATAVLDEIIKDGMSDYEKEKAVYDWMIKNLKTNKEGLLSVIPTTTQDSDNPYGTLKYHNAVCVGYAVTFRMFMQMLDIDCHVVHNTDKIHSWDLVELDGEWYHVDVYTDITNENNSTFNLNDTMMMTNQTWDTTYFPSAVGIKYNYAYQNSVVVKTFDEVLKKLYEAMEKGETSLFLKCQDIKDKDLKVIETAMTYISGKFDLNLSADGMTDSSVSINGNDYLALSWQWSSPKQDEKLLIINLTKQDEIEDELTSKESQKIYDKIDKIFDFPPESGFYNIN
ncbi:Transglutaminase-like predicted protease domain fused ChW-repeat and cell-adhesion domain protein [Lachnospiraceae bacterium TWA4]|nr:Transglutaminase-like predicted protease domain fused ChW-repeat and cell-adhesion domain protein [Lachnospiraceae bacterium TWA4]